MAAGGKPAGVGVSVSVRVPANQTMLRERATSNRQRRKERFYKTLTAKPAEVVR